MTIWKIIFAALLLVSLTACRIVELQIDADFGGAKVHVGLAEFSTTHEIDIPEIKIPFIGGEDE